MKQLICSIAIILLIASSTFAQTLETPQKEFVIVIESKIIDMKTNDSQKNEIKILKSKSYQKSEAEVKISSTLPAGVAVAFNPNQGNFDVSEMTITTSSETKPGQYTLIVSATLNYKTKASILKLNVQ